VVRRKGSICLRKIKKKDKEKWEGETRDGLGSSVDTSGSSEDRVQKSVFYSDLALIPCLSTLQIKLQVSCSKKKRLQVSGRALFAHAHCENTEDPSQSPREYMGFRKQRPAQNWSQHLLLQ
jgi:hypothetical protein